MNNKSVLGQRCYLLFYVIMSNESLLCFGGRSKYRTKIIEAGLWLLPLPSFPIPLSLSHYYYRQNHEEKKHFKKSRVSLL